MTNKDEMCNFYMMYWVEGKSPVTPNTCFTRVITRTKSYYRNNVWIGVISLLKSRILGIGNIMCKVRLYDHASPVFSKKKKRGNEKIEKEINI